MKKFVFTLFAFGLLTGLAACNKSGGGSASTPTCDSYYFNGSFYVDANGRQVNCADTYGRGYGMGYGMNNCMNYTYNRNQNYFMNPMGQRMNCVGMNMFDGINYNPYYTNQGNGCAIYNGIGGKMWFPVNAGGRLMCMGEDALIGYGVNVGPYMNGGIINANCQGGTLLGGLIGWGFCGY